MAGGLANLLVRDALKSPADRATPMEKAQIAAREITKRLPLMVDRETRLDAVVAGAWPRGNGVRLLYDYTLVNVAAGTFDTLAFFAVKKQVTDATCAQKGKNVLKYGIGMQFQYRASDGTVIDGFGLTPEDCLKRR